MVNLFGFAGPEIFLTKTGDAGIVLEVKGVDYECLDQTSIDALTKRLESALRLFDENYRIYQPLFKRNRETIPHTYCGKTIVDTAIRNRIATSQRKQTRSFPCLSSSLFFVRLFLQGVR
jgi:type IV secretion system protein VirB4